MRIGSLRVNARAARAALVPGRVLTVAGPIANGELTPTLLRVEPEIPFEGRLRRLSLEGFVQDAARGGRFRLANLDVDASSFAASGATPIARDARIRVLGSLSGEAGLVPHTSIDTEAGWTKSDWHGWVYGWKLHLVTTVADVWIPLAAEVTPANAADNETAPRLLPELPPAVGFLLGDTHYNDPDLRERCAAAGRELVATRRGAYPHTDGGVEVRRIFHRLRSRAIENFNGQLKAIFDCSGQVPTRGLVATRRSGREVLYRPTPGPMSEALEWMAEVGAQWDDRLAALERQLARRRQVSA